MAEKQKRAVNPRFAGVVLAVLVVTTLCLGAWIGWHGTQTHSQPAWLVVIFFVGFGGVALFSAGSYEKFTSLCLSLLGLFAFALGAIFLIASAVMQFLPRASFIGMWLMLVTLAAAVGAIIEVIAAVRLKEHTDESAFKQHSKQGFWNAAFSQAGRRWFTSCCGGVMILLVATYLF